jgi:hypothetical protein
MEVLNFGRMMLRALFPSDAWLASWAWPLLVLSVVLLALAYFLEHVLRRRRFYRRNIAGVEEFRSYRHVVVTGLQETGIVLMGAAIMLASFFSFGASIIGFAYQ